MTTTYTSTAIAVAEPAFTSPERLALAGFLAGYTGLTREAYALDLRQFAAWCQRHQLRLFEARRADIECFARDLEARGRAKRGKTSTATATIGRPESPLCARVWLPDWEPRLLPNGMFYVNRWPRDGRGRGCRHHPPGLART